MLTKSKYMTDEGFVEFCYQTILKRSPDEEGRRHYENVLGSGQLSRENMLIQFVTCVEYVSKTASLEFVPPGHFFSAIPSIEERDAFISSAQSDNSEILGINLNTHTQVDLLKQFICYYDQCPFPENKSDEFRYYFSNTAYGHTDALTLYSMIRQFSPQRIAEIGSGFSSCVMLDTSDCFFDGNIEFTFIEPYPELLHSLIKHSDKRHTIIPKKVQEVDNSIFSTLKANDILFVDSTHVSKLNSDVNKIIFEILPSLQKGVLIHFHDIFWQFEYPKEWIAEGRAWNESYIVRAFLEFNDTFEIIFSSGYLHKHQFNVFKEHMPSYLKNTGGNLWIRKIKD